MGVASVGGVSLRNYLWNQIRVQVMAKITIELETEQFEDEQILRMLSRRTDIMVAISELINIRWKHIESIDQAERQVRDIVEPFYGVFNE